jgi:hypothetical protein
MNVAPPDRNTPTKRHRRLVAVPQAAIARAVRVASDAGPTWHVEIEGNVVRLFQGAPPASAKVTPEDGFARGLGIVP